MMCNMCKCEVRLLFCVVIALQLILVNTFNLDTFNYAIFRGDPGSMFGFSVATHTERGNSWVLVGAPEAQGQLRQVNRGGVVYRCNPLQTHPNDTQCQEVPFDTKGDRQDSRGRPIEQKSYQWFGATIHSAGPESPIVACAPRYIWYTNKGDRKDPVGNCYVASDDFRTYSEYSPCRTSLRGYHRQGSCQAGFSAGISKDGRRLFVGAPGSWYWQGQTYSVDPATKFPFTPGIFGGAFGSGQVIRQSLDHRPAAISTREGPETDDDSYMGYSMVVGDFSADGVDGVAVGMPKGAHLAGKVILFTWNLTNYLNLTGSQLGEYFGYSLAAADVDGDKKVDLIIGAPLYTEPNNKGIYDVGRVHIAYQKSGYLQRTVLDGFHSKSRFGLAVACLGDINLDGYEDIAIGAPYGGSEGRGAVYIYLGSSEGLKEKYSQVIYAEDVSGDNFAKLYTFGFSISGGIDLDGNEYPDMAVGTYLNDTAHFFRARPVVNVNAMIEFLTEHKQVFLNQKGCSVFLDNQQQDVVCTDFQVCLGYGGTGAPPSVVLGLKYILDARKAKENRMFFNGDMRKTTEESVTLYKDTKPYCIAKTIHIKNDIRDKLTPLEVQLKYTLEESSSFQQQYHRDPRTPLVPILGFSSQTAITDSIQIHKNCGRDNVCIPNLSLTVQKTVEKYLYESDKNLQFQIEVQNNGEDSYETVFYIHLPPGIHFSKVNESDVSIGRVFCYPAPNDTIYGCDVGNPLMAGKIVRFKIELEPQREQLLKPSYDFYMNVTSRNPEIAATLKDNEQHVSVPVWIHAKLVIEGSSHLADVYYNVSQFIDGQKLETEYDVGPPVIHRYTITNNGPSRIEEAEIFIVWPYATLAGDDLLYLLQQPHTLGNVKCDQVEANYRRYQEGKHAYTVWETLNITYTKEDLGVLGYSKGTTQSPTVEKGKKVVAGIRGETDITHVDERNETRFESGDASSVLEERHRNRVHEGGTQRGHGRVQGGSYHEVHTGGGYVGQGSQQAQGGGGYTETGTSVQGGQYGHTEGGRDHYGSTHVGGQFGQVEGDGGGQYGHVEGGSFQEAHAEGGQQGQGYGHGTIQNTMTTGPVSWSWTNTTYRNITRILGPDGRILHEYVDEHTVPENNGDGGSNRHQFSSESVNVRNVTRILGQNGQVLQEFVDGVEVPIGSSGIPIRTGSQVNSHSYNAQSQSGGGVYGEQRRGQQSTERGQHEQSNYERRQHEQNIHGSTYTRTYQDDVRQDFNRRQGSYAGHGNAGGIEGAAAGSGFRTSYIGFGANADQNLDEHARREFESKYSASRQYEGNMQHDGGHNALTLGDNVATHAPDYNRGGIHNRGKRQVFHDATDDDIRKIEDCKTSKCITIKCRAGPLNVSESIHIALRARINAYTLKSISTRQPIRISSTMLARISQFHQIAGVPLDRQLERQDAVTNVAAPEPDVKPDVVPLWVVILSAVAGTLILLLLIYILYKLGFFKRNRPSNSPERQPLNRNGHFSHGDEAL